MPPRFHCPDLSSPEAVLAGDELHHLRWALAGFHQQIGTTETVGARAAEIDEKLRGGVINLGGVPQ